MCKIGKHYEGRKGSACRRIYRRGKYIYRYNCKMTIQKQQKNKCFRKGEYNKEMQHKINSNVEYRSGRLIDKRRTK